MDAAQPPPAAQPQRPGFSPVRWVFNFAISALLFVVRHLVFGRERLALYGAGVVAVLGVLLKLYSGVVTTLYSETYCYDAVRTHLPGRPHVNCFTVGPYGAFLKVFNEKRPKKLAKYKRPGYAIPGLWDGHGHLLQYGEFLSSVDLFGSTSFDDTLARIRVYVSQNDGVGSRDEWIRGVGWDQMALGRMPTAADFSKDEMLKDKFIMLDRVDVHCAWVSQAVLDLLPEDIPDVPGGEIVREPGMGVFCDNAMDLVTSVWPKPGKEKKSKMIKDAMKELNKVGLVGMHDAGVTPGNLNLFKELAGGDDWTVRVYAMLECDERNTYCGNEFESYWHPGNFLAIASVKLFADGALGSWGSALIDPYSDRPDTSGSLLINATELTWVTAAWLRAGFQVNIHAIGDLANRNAIDAIAFSVRLFCTNYPGTNCESVGALRTRIEHAQIIHPDDQVRLRKYGIIPSIQPTHATSDMAYAETRLGKERTTTEAYRMKSLLDRNPVLGSDFPVEPPNPFQGIYAAVTRKNPHTGLGKDGSQDGWYTEEALTLDEALQGFTIGPAGASFQKGKAGIIGKGAYSDWVVLDRPIEDIEIEDLRTLRVKETWVAGKKVYDRDAVEQSNSDNAESDSPNKAEL